MLIDERNIKLAIVNKDFGSFSTVDFANTEQTAIFSQHVFSIAERAKCFLPMHRFSRRTFFLHTICFSTNIFNSFELMYECFL